MENKIWTPLFEIKDKPEKGQFFLLYNQYCFETEYEAWETGMGFSIVEGVLFGWRFIKPFEFDPENIEHVVGNFSNGRGTMSVAFINGEAFESKKNDLAE